VKGKPERCKIRVSSVIFVFYYLCVYIYIYIYMYTPCLLVIVEYIKMPKLVMGFKLLVIG